ncbi:hypothetical protein [Scytonema sp. PCC 10023]|uniref:hypothetical protein n=1 Tax=Scytonema sp. PCC 10023 TaxID=1680591 RepID=UPI0039C755CC
MKITSSSQDYDAIIEGSRTFHQVLPLEVAKDENFYPAFHTISEYWQTARNWVIKEEWDNKCKVHPSKLIRDALKPRGNLLIKYFKLCERCHAFQDVTGVKVPFKNAGFWFAKIFNELWGMETEFTINPPEEFVENSFKKTWIFFERQKLKKIRSNENPFIENKNAEGLSVLIDTAISLKESKKFHKDYWKPFLEAYSAYINDLDKNSYWGRGYTDQDGKYFRQSGRGRGGQTRVLMGTAKQYMTIQF